MLGSECQTQNSAQACWCGQGGAEALAKAGDEAWRMPLGAAVLSVRHIGLSGWSQAECAALENELTAWQQAGKFQERDQALRCSALHYDI